MEEGKLKAELNEIELSIEQAEKKVKLAEQLERLFENEDFKALIDEGFMKEYALRMVKLRAHPAMQEDRDQRIINEKIEAVGTLNQYFQAIFAEGRHAEGALEQAVEARNEIEKEIEAEGNEV